VLNVAVESALAPRSPTKVSVTDPPGGNVVVVVVVVVVELVVLVVELVVLVVELVVLVVELVVLVVELVVLVVELVVLVVELVVVGAGSPVVRSRARARNEAIWSRVTRASGQYRVFSGGLQPFVTPAVPSRSISLSNTEPSSSANRFDPRPARNTKPRTRKAAI
jgi:hypothetical protein